MYEPHELGYSFLANVWIRIAFYHPFEPTLIFTATLSELGGLTIPTYGGENRIPDKLGDLETTNPETGQV